MCPYDAFFCSAWIFWKFFLFKAAWYDNNCKQKKLPSLKLTAKPPENRPGPKKESSFPTINLQVRAVSFREE